MARQRIEFASLLPEVPRNQDSSREAIRQEVTEIYQTAGASLLRYALMLARNESLAQDAVQETFLRYYVRRVKGDPRPSSRGWFFRVVRNYIFDQHKSSSAKTSVSLDHAVACSDGRDSPEKVFEQSETVRKVFGLLAPRELECLRLRCEGFTYKEIAEILGIESGTVGALLARGANKVQQAFSKERDLCEAH